MTDHSNDVDLLRRATEQVASVLASISPDQASAPTPCPSWTVTDLANHVLNDMTQFQASASGRELDWRTPAPDVDPTDWSSTFETLSTELLDAWGRADDSAGAIGMQVAELSLHSWDLAHATGQPVTVEDAVAQRGLDWMSGMLKPEYRGTEADGKSFGPEVEAPADASVIDRLAAFSGRSVD